MQCCCSSCVCRTTGCEAKEGASIIVFPLVWVALAHWTDRIVWDVYCCHFKEMTPEQRKELNQAASLRRMCEMKKNGRLNVPEWVHQEFMKGGTARQVLLKHFLACDGDKASYMHRSIQACICTTADRIVCMLFCEATRKCSCIVSSTSDAEAGRTHLP